MSFTRKYDDNEVIDLRLKQSTGEGKYQLNVPGTGTNPDYMEDPHYRLEHWAGNLGNNAINLESDLRGLTRKLNRDEIQKNTHIPNGIKMETRPMAGLNNATTDQSRVTHPAWWSKDTKQQRNEHLFYDPQEYLEHEFASNISSRYEQKK